MWLLYKLITSKMYAFYYSEYKCNTDHTLHGYLWCFSKSALCLNIQNKKTKVQGIGMIISQEIKRAWKIIHPCLRNTNSATKTRQSSVSAHLLNTIYIGVIVSSNITGMKWYLESLAYSESSFYISSQCFYFSLAGYFCVKIDELNWNDHYVTFALSEKFSGEVRLLCFM